MPQRQGLIKLHAVTFPLPSIKTISKRNRKKNLKFFDGDESFQKQIVKWPENKGIVT